MANSEQVAILKKGVQAWNDWRKHNPEADIDLRGADLHGICLSAKGTVRTSYDSKYGQTFIRIPGIGADMVDVDLSESDLTDADLHGVSLMYANLNRANCAGAILFSANLRWTKLAGADLHGANLASAEIISADIRGANLSNTQLGRTVFSDLDLHTVIGLESCHHREFSVVDHVTLMRSGRLPLAFIRGCGFPENLIEYLPSLLEDAVQFYSCFISYSTKDQGFAVRLHADLQRKGVRCWFAPHDIQSGKKVHEQIDQAIRVYDRLLLILSDHSMKSEWVKTEIAQARQKELSVDRRVLFPISLVPFEKIKSWENFDADIGKDSAKEVREYFIPDFSRWESNQDAYIEAFERLLKDLRTERATQQ